MKFHEVIAGVVFVLWVVLDWLFDCESSIICTDAVSEECYRVIVWE